MTIIVALVAVALGAGLGYYILKWQSKGGQMRLAAVEESAAETRAAAEAWRADWPAASSQTGKRDKELEAGQVDQTKDT